MDDKKTISSADFNGFKLVISTPMYRSEVCDAYLDSRRELDYLLNQLGVQRYYGKVKDTYLPRARNILAMQTLETDATHQLLLDSDMGFDASDVVRMLYHAATRSDIDIIGAAYPARVIDWQRVIDAVLRNPQITAEQLRHVAPGKWTFNGLPDGQYDMAVPLELTGKHAHVGTGCMVIRRLVYQAMKKLPVNYTDDVTGKPMCRFFHCDVDKSGIWLGEDVMFCRQWQQMGGKLWLAPWVKTEHWGPMCVPGDVMQVLSAGVGL